MQPTSYSPLRSHEADPHLGFGETTRELVQAHLRAKTNNFALFTFFGFVALAVPTGIGLGVAAGISSSALHIGASAGGGLGLLAIAACLIYIYYFRYHPTPYNDMEPEDDGQPKLGEIIPGNHVYVTQHSQETNVERNKLIGKANHLLQISGNFCGGAVFREMLEKVRARMSVEKSELITKLLMSWELLEFDDLQAVKALRKEFPDRFFYLVTNTKIDRRTGGSVENHVKLTVVDQTCFVIGGTGIEQSLCASDGLKPPAPIEGAKWAVRFAGWAARDMDTLIQGPSARVASKQFEKLWARWQHNMYYPKPSRVPFGMLQKSTRDANDVIIPRPIADVALKVLISDPDKPSAIMTQYVEAIESAQKGEAIRIAHSSFNPNERIMQALFGAINRGVNVELVTTGISDTSPNANWHIAKGPYMHYLHLMVGRSVKWYERLKNLNLEKKDNVKIRVYKVANTQFHKKVMTVANRTLMIGSTNLTKKAESDYEMNVKIEDDRVVAATNAVIDNDFDDERSRVVDFNEAYKGRFSFLAWWQANPQGHYYV